MNENDFNSDLAAGLRSQGLFAHKLPDLAYGVTKPFDIVANCHGRFWAIEGKLKKVALKKGLTDFPPELVVIDRYEKKFRTHQLPNLEMIAAQDGVGFVGVYLAEDRPGSRLKAAWLVPVAYFLQKESWTVQQLNSLAFSFPTLELTWGPKRGWLASDWLINSYGPVLTHRSV